MSMLSRIDKEDDAWREEFLRDRREALLSLDPAKIIAYAEKYDVPGLAESAAIASQDPNGGFWVIVHKARTGALDLPAWAREMSRRWLHQHGHSAMDEGGGVHASC